MDAHVELLLARRLLLLPHVRLVLVVDEVDDRRPAIAVVDIVAEAGRVDDGQPDAEVLLLELGFDDVAAPSATAMVAERTSRSSCRIASHDGGCSCESRRAPSRRWCWPIRRETASADALDQRRLAEPRLAHDHQREVPSPLGDCEVSRRWCGRERTDPMPLVRQRRDANADLCVRQRCSCARSSRFGGGSRSLTRSRTQLSRSAARESAGSASRRYTTQHAQCRCRGAQTVHRRASVDAPARQGRDSRAPSRRVREVL